MKRCMVTVYEEVARSDKIIDVVEFEEWLRAADPPEPPNRQGGTQRLRDLMLDADESMGGGECGGGEAAADRGEAVAVGVNAGAASSKSAAGTSEEAAAAHRASLSAAETGRWHCAALWGWGASIEPTADDRRRRAMLRGWHGTFGRPDATEAVMESWRTQRVVVRSSSSSSLSPIGWDVSELPGIARQSSHEPSSSARSRRLHGRHAGRATGHPPRPSHCQRQSPPTRSPPPPYWHRSCGALHPPSKAPARPLVKAGLSPSKRSALYGEAPSASPSSSAATGAAPEAVLTATTSIPIATSSQRPAPCLGGLSRPCSSLSRSLSLTSTLAVAPPRLPSAPAAICKAASSELLATAPNGSAPAARLGQAPGQADCRRGQQSMGGAAGGAAGPSRVGWGALLRRTQEEVAAVAAVTASVQARHASFVQGSRHASRRHGRRGEDGDKSGHGKMAHGRHVSRAQAEAQKIVAAERASADAARLAIRARLEEVDAWRAEAALLTGQRMEVEVELRTEAEMEVQAEAEAQAEAGTNAGTDAETDVEREMEAEAVEADAEAEVEVETEAEAEVEAETEAEAEAAERAAQRAVVTAAAEIMMAEMADAGEAAAAAAAAANAAAWEAAFLKAAEEDAAAIRLQALQRGRSARGQLNQR